MTKDQQVTLLICIIIALAGSITIYTVVTIVNQMNEKYTARYHIEEFLEGCLK